MPQNHTFFRADEDEPVGEQPKPTPGDWIGNGGKKFNTGTPAFSEQKDPEAPGDGYDGWRETFQGHPRDPLWNPLLGPAKKEETIRFRDMNSDARALIYVLESASEIFESEGHLDLAAECEDICELICEEDKPW